MKLALTYDDGPETPWTERVLDLLAEEEATATFFVIAGRATALPSSIERMLAEGHEVGLHCREHRRHTEMTAAQIADDTHGALELLETVGVKPSTWRTPWGVTSDATFEISAEHGLRICGWNFDSHDWRGDPAGEMLDALERQGGIRDGTIALMHDGLGPGALREGCGQTVDLTRELLRFASRTATETVTASAILSARAAA